MSVSRRARRGDARPVDVCRGDGYRSDACRGDACRGERVAAKGVTAMRVAVMQVVASESRRVCSGDVGVTGHQLTKTAAATAAVKKRALSQ